MGYDEDKNMREFHNSGLIFFNSLEPFCVQGSSFVNRLPCDSEK